MKLKDLLKGRDKLRKYDELKWWEGYFERGLIINKIDSTFQYDIKSLPDSIKQIILDAIDAEIQKMEEE